MLKSLEIHGFKSFADRTRFEFHSGITAIVGPNGSGKSNVVDAVKWILGDQSAKSLRGKEMTDVIFNGATGRQSSGLAEATLTFDNSSGFLPSEFQEVQIGRRIMRSGDADYLINGATSRLKDVRELFAGTGAGASAYAIIEQGRVDQILQANAANRRQVFEEAAGISRYKARKAEALRKMERVEQNLLRLTDIVDEVEARLNSTRSQAAKAAKFREVSQELKELWLGLAADDHRHLSGSLHQIETDLAGYQAEIDKLNAELLQAEERQAAHEVEVAEVDDRLREVERQRADRRETIARHDATNRHQSARRVELDAELARLRSQSSRMSARSAEAASEREYNARNLDEAERESSQRQEKLRLRAQRLQQFDENMELARIALGEHKQKLGEFQQRGAAETRRAAALEAQQATAAQRRQEVLQRCGEIDRQLEACGNESAQHEELVEKAQALTNEADSLRQGMRARRESLLSEHAQFRQTLAQQREQRSAGQARQSVLEDMEGRQEGLGIGVKEILSRAKTSDYPPWNSIIGSAADLLTVDLEHAALLEVAIGERSQLVVVDRYEPLIEYLAKGDYRIDGRVGFVVAANETGAAHVAADSHGPFEHFHIDEDALPDLSERDGVLGRADRLVKSRPEAEGLAARLLSDTWIVDTLDVALSLSSEAGRGCRFVTRLGELLEPDGTIVVGSVRAETAIISRRSELRGLKRELGQLERKIEREEKRLASLDDSLKQADEELAGAEAAYRETIEALSACEAELAERRRESERLTNDRRALEEEAERCAAEQRQVEEQSEQTLRDLAAAEDEVRVLEEEIDRTEQHLARRTERRQLLEQRRAAEQLDAAKSEERLHGLRDTVSRLDRDLDQRRQQQSEADRRLLLVREKCSQITLHLLNTSAEVAELLLVDEEAAERASRLLRQRERLRSVRQQNQRGIDSVRQQRREQKDAMHQQELRLSEIRNQLAGFSERIEEEYQIDLDEVVAAGRSAYAAYLDELRNERGGAAAEELEADDTSTGAALQDELSERPGPIEKPGFSVDDDLPSFDNVREELESRVNRLRRRLKLMGNVNADSLSDLDELEERHTRLSDQLSDLVEARGALEEIIRRINIESRRLFAETFASIRGHFQELFRKLFGGGEADIVLEDAEDVLECGIDVVARPPGKELRSISLLSGGEKTMTAVALLLAIFKSRPSPFCILDEVDAALDEANLGRFVSLLKEFRTSTQFIMISHRKPSMTQADVLYGVTMEQSGVSKRMSVRFEDVGEDGSFRPSSPGNEAGVSAQNGEMNAAA